MNNQDNKLKLPNVTLVAAASIKVYETIKALEYSMREIEFGEVVLVSHRKPRRLPKEITFKQCEPIDNINKFNFMMVYDLSKYVTKEYALLVHYDGFVVHPEAWQDEFLSYDYIGSPWPIPDIGVENQIDAEGNIVRVGNSVSLRSRRLLDFPRANNLAWESNPEGDYNEDIFICVKNKVRMEKAGLRFATLDVAKYFGREHPLPENEKLDTFVFHKWWGPNAGYPQFKDPKARVYEFLTNITRPARNVLGIHKRRKV